MVSKVNLVPKTVEKKKKFNCLGTKLVLAIKLASDKPKYMHICSSKYGQRAINENDPGISPALDKPPGEDKPISPSLMTRRYKVNNEPPYH